MGLVKTSLPPVLMGSVPEVHLMNLTQERRPGRMGGLAEVGGVPDSKILGMASFEESIHCCCGVVRFVLFEESGSISRLQN